MKRVDYFQLGAYAAAASFAVGGAFLISLRYVGPARAQEGAPPSQPPAAESSPPAPPSADATPTNQEAPPQAPPASAATPDAGKNPSSAASSAQSGIAEIEAFLEPFIYDVVNRRDPFQPYAEYAGPGAEDTQLNNLSPSQRWDLEQLKLVGIMWDVRAPKAMFMDPEQDVMVLGRDESIGKRNGYIAAIREGEVVVVEAIRKRGDIIYKTKVLRIER